MIKKIGDGEVRLLMKVQRANGEVEFYETVKGEHRELDAETYKQEGGK